MCKWVMCYCFNGKRWRLYDAMKEYRQKIHVAKLVAFLAAVLCFIIGCEHCRVVAIAKVKDCGSVVMTRNRYKLVALKVGTQGENHEVTSANVEWQGSNDLNEKLIEAMPQVFADDGIPFALRRTLFPHEYLYPWTVVCPYILSLTTLPMFNSSEYRYQYTVDVVDVPNAHAKFEGYARIDSAATTVTPFPLLFYIGDIGTPDGYENCRKYSRHRVDFFGDTIIGETYANINMCLSEALAYGIAATLKQMEDDGVIDANCKSVAKTAGQPKEDAVVGAKMELVDFKRESGYDHRYSFILRLAGVDLSLRESREIQNAMRTMIREDYLASFPFARRDLLVVDFSQYLFDKGQITGRAVVLTLRVISLEYDPNSRRGVMGVRLGPNQYEDARMYVRKNIEELVRDKNIALVAGKIPPDATFYLLGETLRDDVMEVEFRTE